MSLTFQTVQNKHKGLACQTFLQFLLIKEPCHPNRVSLLDKDSTQDTKKRKKQLPWNPCLFTMEKQMIYRFFMVKAQVTPIY